MEVQDIARDGAPLATGRGTVLGLVALAMMGTGCFATRTGIAGAVHASQQRCADQPRAVSPPGAPLRGAQVAVHCPGESAPRFTEATDQAGRFFIEIPSDQGIPMDCEIVVEQDGFRSRRFAVAEACAAEGYEHCEAASVFAELALAPPPAAETPLAPPAAVPPAAVEPPQPPPAAASAPEPAAPAPTTTSSSVRPPPGSSEAP